jgi:murein DD-endopeptidase MepM/ murein hydrolase activator NlpD
MKPDEPMKRLSLFLLLCSFLLPASAQDATETPLPPILRPAPTSSQSNGALNLNRYFGSLVQGQVGLLQLTGENIQEARVLFRSREYPFSNSNTDGWYAFVVADIDAQARDYPLAVIVRLTDGSTLEFAETISIESGGYVRLIFDVPANLAYLIDPVIERNEYARIDALVAETSPERLWTKERWIAPIANQPFSSNFGQYRILNDSVQTRHTGWDQTTPTGTAVNAMQAGEVIFAGQLDIRGNYIMINHGWGVYSGYAHLSQMNVARGDRVEQGQIIGASGTTGRSSGPHLHWEIALEGEWIDGALFLEMWLP